MRKPNIAFICVHNSCRSQMAEALGKSSAPMCLKATQPVRKPSLKSTRMQYV